MGRKSRLKRQRRQARLEKTPAVVTSWIDDDGVHAVVPGKAPSPEMLEKMTRQYQKSIRDSPMWDQMVDQFGKKKAEELLKKCKAELR